MAKLSWRYGAMNAGKSAALLAVAHNYETLGLTVKVFTAALDDRYGVGVVASRMGIRRDAAIYKPETVFESGLIGTGISCVLVDEAQWLRREQVVQLHRIAAVHDIAVICFGLRSDFRGDPFEGAAALGVYADSIEELRTLCSCGKRAGFNVRVDDQGRRVREGAQILIGGNDRYRASCARCFYAD